MLQTTVVVFIAFIATIHAQSQSPDCILSALRNYANFFDPYTPHDLSGMLGNVTDDEWDTIRNTIGNHTTQFCTATEQVIGATNKRAVYLGNNELQSPPYNYDPGSVWWTYIQLAVVFPNLLYGAGGSPYWQETGDWNTEAALTITQQALKFAEYALDATCGGGGIPCVAKSVLEILGMIIDTVVDAVGLEDTMIHEVNNAESWVNTEIIWESVQCRTGPIAGKTHGCNGQNDNCDEYFTIDECIEDIMPPEFFFSPPYLDNWFLDIASAEAAVALMTTAFDDCHSVSVTYPIVAVDCADSYAQVSATDACGNWAEVYIPFLRIDGVPPTVSCGVTLTEMVSNAGYMNVGFWYSVSDNCVTPTTSIWLTLDEPQQESNQACIVSYDSNGEFRTIFLDGITNGGSDGRVYHINIEAVDAAGNSATCSAQVSVSAPSGAAAIDSGQIFTAPCM